MHRIAALVAVVAALEAGPSGAAERVDPGALFHDYDVVDLDLAVVVPVVEATGHLSLSVFGRRYDLVVEPNNLMAEGYRSVAMTPEGAVDQPVPPVRTYKGRVAGEEPSDVRLLVDPQELSGHVRTGRDWILIDPLSRYDPEAPPGRLVVYRSTDIRPEFSGRCAVDDVAKVASTLWSGPGPFGRPTALTAPRVIEIATEADHDFYVRSGRDADRARAHIQGIVNQVEGIYLAELGLTFRITFQSVWTFTFLDPYATTDAHGLLVAFQTLWNNTWQSVTRDVAYLFTGKRLDGDIVGAARPCSICKSDFVNRRGDEYAYGLTQGVDGLREIFLVGAVPVTAHEIGHTLSAEHDDDFDPTVCDGTGPLMCSTVQFFAEADVFSPVSKEFMVEHVNQQGSCLEIGRNAEFRTSDGAGNLAALGTEKTWRIGWHAIVPGNFGGHPRLPRTDLLFYDRARGEGEFYTSDGNGNLAALGPTHTTWRDTWDLIVPGDFGGDARTDLLFYDASAGEIEFHTVDASGSTLPLWTTQGGWGSAWDRIVPGRFNADSYTDLLFYDRDTQTGQIYTTNGTGVLTPWGAPLSWTRGWDLVVAGNFDADGLTDFLFYERATGHAEFHAMTAAGTLVPLGSPHLWRRTWDLIVPGNFGGGDAITDLLFYDGSAGQYEIDTTSAGVLGALSGVRPSRTSWGLIVPGNFGRTAPTDLLFYER
jgi:hypothetical protein